jgi:hypothetical protein
MHIWEFEIVANHFRPNTPKVHFDLYLFKTVDNMNKWHRRKSVEGHTPFGAAVCQMSLQSPNCLGTLLLSVDRLDPATISHEAVHMAKLYAKRIHKLRDEELLCEVTGYIVDHTLAARPKFRKQYAKT